MFPRLSVARLLALAAIAVLCVLFYPHLNAQSVSAFVRDNGVAAPVVFIVICAVRPILFFLPSMGLTVVAGVLFGTFWGTVYVVIGGALSTPVGFYAARWLGRDTVERLIEKSGMLRQMTQQGAGNRRNTVLYMRLVNVPWDLVSYWAGLSGLSFKDFYIASLVPLVPVSFLYTYFGSNVFRPLSAGFVVPLLIMLAMGAVPFVKSRCKKRSNG